MLLAIIPAVILALAAPASPAAPPPPPAVLTNFTNVPLDQALADSIAGHRLLIVVVSNTPDRARKNLAPFNNALVAKWVERNAIAIHITDQLTIQTLTAGGLKIGDPEQPLLFRDGKQERLFGSTIPANISRIRAVPKEAAQARAEHKAKDAKANNTADDAPSTSLRLYAKLDWTLRSVRRRDPAWWEAHEQTVPKLASPPIREPTAMTPAERDPLGELARMQIALADKSEEPDRLAAEAVFLFTRGVDADEAFEPAALTTLARVMNALVAAHPQARGPIEQAARHLFASLRLEDYRALFRFLILQRILGDQIENLDFLDSALDDPDAKLLMPLADRAAIEQMLPRLAFTDPLILPSTGNPVRYIESLRKGLADKQATTMTDQEFGALRSFRAAMLRLESARLYSALLTAKKDDQAAQLATVALQPLDAAPEAGAPDGGAAPVAPSRSGLAPIELLRRAMLTCALADSQPRAAQLAWLEGQQDPAAAVLRAQLQAMLDAIKALNTPDKK